MIMEPTLTKSQDAALKQAYDLLTEHFDHSLICVETEVDQSTDDGQQQQYFTFLFYGGRSTAAGMATRAVAKIVNGDDADD
jgi:hypothetical protein